MQTIEIKLNMIICGKSEEKLKDFPNNFFGGSVTDPPYELNFMSKKWDATGIAYSVELWKEVLRVLKPGAYLLCFGGTRTHHRVTCAIEDAGFIIKDEISWCYGEGFPKSTDISKQLDKEAGVEREVIGEKFSGLSSGRGGDIAIRFTDSRNEHGMVDITAPATEDAKRWDGYGTGLKPAYEPIIVAMKPLEKGLTYAQNAKKWGAAGLNIDGSRIGTDIVGARKRTLTESGNTNMLGVNKQIDFQGKPAKGRFPANLILSHSSDCIHVGTKQINEGAPEGGYNFDESNNENNSHIVTNIKSGQHYSQETIEVWACVPDCPIRILDTQSGSTKSVEKARLRKNVGFHEDNLIYGHGKGEYICPEYGDLGGASRFFYCSKASKSEKEAGLLDIAECVKCNKFDSKTHTVIIDGEKKKERCLRNNHPTVKPLDLMKYLLGLIKMPSAKENKQVVLDPFCGSGTTLVAAEQLGINYIGIDMDSDNCLTSIGRIGA